MEANISSRILLSDGNAIPAFGLGFWEMEESEAGHNAVIGAIKKGYRLFDTARYYKNESMLGRALKESGLSRQEYFIVTKLHPAANGYEKAKLNLNQSLMDLGVEYVDLFLIHSPKSGKNIETWKAFVELKKAGLAKSIGVSNFNVQHLEPLLATGMEVPVVNQFELHPWNQHKSTVKYCKEKNIAVMGYCPLARGKMFADGKCPILDNLSASYAKSKAQIILKWAVQSGFVTIPKSTNVQRIEENGDLFGWTISEGDMDLLGSLDEELSISSADQVMDTQWQG